MKIFVVTQEAVTDFEGRIIDYGRVINVVASQDAAVDEILQQLKKSNYGRMYYDYDIEEWDVD